MFSMPARAISGPDPDASKVPPVVCSPGCTSLTVGALCDTAGAQLQISISWTDSLGNYLGTIGPILLVAEKVASWGASFRGFNSDGTEPIYHVGGYYAYVQVMGPTPLVGKWSLTGGAQ